MNEKVARLDNQLNDIQFQKDERGVFLHCVEMKSMHGCENYQVNIEHVDGDYVTSKKDFRYDDVQVKEAIVPAITLLNELELPIGQIRLNRLYAPSDIEEDQFFTEEELKESSEERVHFRSEYVTVKNIKQIRLIEDLLFERTG